MNRTWLWKGAILVAAGVIFWAVGQAVNPSSGDTELKKTLEATEQVKSFRGAFIASASGAMHSENIWEVDCNRVIVHQQSHDAQASTDSPFEMKQDEILVGEQRYNRGSDGSWENLGFAGERYSAKWYCDNIARGTVRDLLPDMRTMLSHALFEKGATRRQSTACAAANGSSRSGPRSPRRTVRFASVWTIICPTS